MSQQPDVERDAAEQVDPEDLSDIDIGLEDGQILRMVAKQRFDLAREYQAGALTLEHLRLSVRANESAGNEDAAGRFRTMLGELAPQVQHLLRSIKSIDTQFPHAREEMQRQIERANLGLRK